LLCRWCAFAIWLAGLPWATGFARLAFAGFVRRTVALEIFEVHGSAAIGIELLEDGFKIGWILAT
jgi:hypothetical protein